MQHLFTTTELYEFIDLASKSTYASGKPPEETTERANFREYTFSQGEWSYRDSYTGFTRSAGQEIVRFGGQIAWAQAYCGGMTEGNEDRAEETFAFLKAALSQPTPGLQSLRGPEHFKDGNWEYHYTQDGDVTNYVGYEEILHTGKVVFFHRTIGGVVKN